MPKLTTITPNDTCFYCGRQAQWISINSKKKRCEEKSNRCPAIIQKAQASRDANTTPEKRRAHMKLMSQKGNAKLQELHEDPKWLANKSAKISDAVEKRGGHGGANNPMYGKQHNKLSKQKQESKAQTRDPECYKKAIDTKIEKGIAIPKHCKTAFELYEEKVDNITYKSWRWHQNKINPNNLPRGELFELDHKFSKTEGFINNVPPEIIGHYANLELIPKNKNRSKRTKCSITLAELYKATR